MTKSETKKLLNKIKGYYNSQFFIDEYVIDAWDDTMKEYTLEDAEEHINKYLKEFPDTPPKPHTFIKGLLTKEQKIQLANEKYFIECNLCHKWMGLNQYDEHYERCLDIEYLVNVAKEKGQSITRKELEGCKKEIIDRLLQKYKPTDEQNWFRSMQNEKA